VALWVLPRTRLAPDCTRHCQWHVLDEAAWPIGRNVDSGREHCIFIGSATLTVAPVGWDVPVTSSADGRIRLVQGDITRIAVDGIVNAANSGLRGGGGVDGAIHRTGGPSIMADLERRYGARRHCPTGQAVISDAGALPARFVVHAVGPVWHGGDQGEADLLAGAYRTALDLAAAAGCRTIALPSISTGVYGYPIEQAAPLALATVKAWLDEHPGVLDAVTFVLFSGDSLGAFERALTAAGG